MKTQHVCDIVKTVVRHKFIYLKNGKFENQWSKPSS